jgi:hypothetical protein
MRWKIRSGGGLDKIAVDGLIKQLRERSKGAGGSGGASGGKGS